MSEFTESQLREMSDFEVNKALSLMIYPKASIFQSMADNQCITINADSFVKVLVDYCNNPSDIMPLAFDRGISLMKVESYPEWKACIGVDIDCGDISYNADFHDKSPLRAIACLILLMGK